MATLLVVYMQCKLLLFSVLLRLGDIAKDKPDSIRFWVLCIALHALHLGQFFLGAGYCPQYPGRNSVLEELRVSRLPVIQEEIC